MQSASGHRPAPQLTEEDTITELMEEHLEDLEPQIAPLPHIEFEIGDSVVYPHHGAGKVLRKEMKEVLGESREYLTIKILHNDMTVMVPTENAALAGLRRVIDEETVKKVLAVLRTSARRCPRTGTGASSTTATRSRPATSTSSPRSCATSRSERSEKGLSTGEKQMFTRAKKILASELMYALEMDEQEVEEHLYGLLVESNGNGNGNGTQGPTATARWPSPRSRQRTWRSR